MKRIAMKIPHASGKVIVALLIARGRSSRQRGRTMRRNQTRENQSRQESVSRVFKLHRRTLEIPMKQLRVDVKTDTEWEP